MARTRLIAVNGSAGAFTPIFATQSTRSAYVIEDASANAGVGQGFSYQFDDNQTPPFTTVYSVAPGTEPVILGTPIPQSTGAGRVIGRPADSSNGYTTAATLLINVKSFTTTPTIIRLTEND